jgi:hypothetical protein
MAQVTSSATRSKRQKASKAVVRSSSGRSNRQGVTNAEVTTRRPGVSGTAGDRVTTGSAGSRVTTGDNRPTGSATNRNITSSQQRGLRTRAAQATGRGGATATGTGARPANQPRGGAPVTQGTGGAKSSQGGQLRIGGAGRLGAAAAGIQAYNTGDSTLKTAQKRGDYKPKQGPADPDRGLSKAASFDKAFAAARKSGKKTFDWNGKKYTTETK